jgi:hypothetical protein
MAYTHVTQCVQLNGHKTFGEVLIAHGVPVAAIAAILGALAGGGVGAAIALGAVSPVVFITGYCDWWFHYRLICILDDQCAVGTVGRTAQSTGLDDPDLDYTINLVLAPVGRLSNLEAAKQLPLLTDPMQRRYYEPQKDAGGNPYPPLDGVNENSTEETAGGTTALHCEIEGDGMKYACAGATVGAILGTGAGIGAGVVAAASCLAFGPFAIVCLLLAALAAVLAAAILTGLGWALGVGLGAIAGHKGAPEDVLIDQGWGTIHVGDHIAVVGDWVFDSAHDGWHELHPVKKILKMQCPYPTTTTLGPAPGIPGHPVSDEEHDKECAAWLGDLRKLLCARIGDADRPEVRDAQTKPQSKWLAHPRLG